MNLADVMDEVAAVAGDDLESGHRALEIALRIARRRAAMARGAVQLILKFIPGMRELGFGQIINLSSAAARIGAERGTRPAPALARREQSKG